MSRAQSRAPRWPDLLIGLLVLLLLAGFAALLLGQRPDPVAQTPPVTEAPTTIVIPSAPGTDLGAGEDPAVTPAPAPDTEAVQSPAETRSAQTPEPEPSAPESPAAEAPAPQTPAVQAPASRPPATEPPTAAAPAPQTPVTTPPVETPQPTPPASATPARPSTTPDAATVVPTDPIPAVPPPPPASSVTLPKPPTAPPSAAPSTPTAGQTPDQPVSTTPAAPPRSGAAVATSEQRTPLRSDYRISLGTFGGESGAQQAAQGVRSLGYTVYSIDLGEQVVAQIGPFADEATARRALADIQRAYPRAVLYPPRGRTLTGGVSESTSAAPAATPAPEAAPAEPEALPTASAPAPSPAAPSTPEPEAATERAPAPSGPVYLQVGAFDRTESAQRLVGLLREEGYAPTVNAPEGRKVTVLIGPFTGDALTRAEDNLDANGFDHFRVR